MMANQELTALVGKELIIRGARHLCLAANDDRLLLLQLCARDEPLLKTGDPVQYIIARHPEWYNGELVWAHGSYFPPCVYRDDPAAGFPCAQALLDAVLALTGGMLYAAMLDNEDGTRCAGLFTSEKEARDWLERDIAEDACAPELRKTLEVERLTLEDYQRAKGELGLDNAYWIEAHRANEPALDL